MRAAAGAALAALCRMAALAARSSACSIGGGAVGARAGAAWCAGAPAGTAACRSIMAVAASAGCGALHSATGKRRYVAAAGAHGSQQASPKRTSAAAAAAAAAAPAAAPALSNAEDEGLEQGGSAVELLVWRAATELPDDSRRTWLEACARARIVMSKAYWTLRGSRGVDAPASPSANTSSCSSAWTDAPAISPIRNRTAVAAARAPAVAAAVAPADDDGAARPPAQLWVPAPQLRQPRPQELPQRESWFEPQPRLAGTQQLPPALPPLPVPNLGYACQNITLRHRRGPPPVITNRSCRRSTVEERGLPHISALALANCHDLLEVLLWNAAAGVRLYRVSSGLLPWAGGQYALEQLPDYEEIAATLAAAGELARTSGQRLTAHPPHYVQLAAKDEELQARSLRLLERESKVFDLMGFAPSPYNKLNIHVGGTYGSKRGALTRFVAAVSRLSRGAAARLTVENDDRPNCFSVADLLPLSAATGIPITFDAHHHRFCGGGLGREEALAAALSTWPAGVRPVVHWSEPPECPRRAAARPHAHSAYVFGPVALHGREAQVDVMLESKAGEQALLLYRDRLQPLYEAGLLHADAAQWEVPLGPERAPPRRRRRRAADEDVAAAVAAARGQQDNGAEEDGKEEAWAAAVN